ncbi:MAG: DMT family transporter [Candidatus Paceibacterota bacterium]|jgi:drug/metabolite transporter (DMT)-like permease
MGLIFAFTALLSWGYGDFLIQKSARRFGDWIALFFIGLFGTVLLLPFIWTRIGYVFLDIQQLLILTAGSAILVFAALLDFEALRRGKISVIEPIFAFEVPITAGLALFILHERISMEQLILVGLLIVGIFLVSTSTFKHFKRMHVERGVFLAIVATIGMGTINYLYGVGSRIYDPLIVNWFVNFFITISTLIYILAKKRWHFVRQDWRSNWKLVTGIGVFDNLAWLTYSYSTLYLPIAIATSLTESYIALAALFGLMFNKEKLRKHQLVGLALTVVCAIILAYLIE